MEPHNERTDRALRFAVNVRAIREMLGLNWKQMATKAKVPEAWLRRVGSAGLDHTRGGNDYVERLAEYCGVDALDLWRDQTDNPSFLRRVQSRHDLVHPEMLDLQFVLDRFKYRRPPLLEALSRVITEYRTFLEMGGVSPETIYGWWVQGGHLTIELLTTWLTERSVERFRRENGRPPTPEEMGKVRLAVDDDLRDLQAKLLARLQSAQMAEKLVKDRTAWPKPPGW